MLAVAVAGPAELQFGHGGDAVGDVECGERSDAKRARFNSATAVTPWVTF